MKKILICLAAMAFIAAAASAANAGDTVRISDVLFGEAPSVKASDPVEDKSKPDASRRVYAQRSAYVKLFGTADVDLVYRSQWLEERLTGVSEDTTFFNPNLTLGLLFVGGQDVSAYVELETPKNYADDFGDPASRQIAIEQMFVEITSLFPDVFGEETLKLRLGVQDIVWKLRDNADQGSFFMDVAQSEDPFWPGMIPGGDPTLKADWGVWDTTSRVSNPGYFEFSGPGFASTVEFGGFKFTLGQLNKYGIKLDFLFGVTRETRQLHEDKSLDAAVFTYKFPKDQGKFLAYLTMFSNNPSSKVWSLGSGLSMYVAGNSCEIFTEMVGQGGTFLENYVNGPDQPNNLGALGTDIKQLAFGGYWGFRYAMPAFCGWYFEGSYWYLTGDPDQTDSRQQNFISFENVDESMIVEGDEYGLDVDTNYKAIKLHTGWVVSQKRKMNVDLFYGYFQRARDRAVGDRIAQEVDLRFKWNYTESCSFMLGAADAWGSQYIPGFLHREMVMFLFNVQLNF